MAKQVLVSGKVWLDNRMGRLVKMEEDELSRYRFEIWFEYTRQAMNEIREGSMLAVRNFTTNPLTTHYSILEVAGVRPRHYVLGDEPRGFPGFIMEAARNASQDWLEQDSIATEDTTYIHVTAIPTNLEMVEYPDGRLEFQEESNIPMIGEEARLLTSEVTEQVVNRDIDLQNEDLMLAGTLLRDDKVKVYLRCEEFIKVHFGIFGFTGAGKSNLLSTLISKLLSERRGREPIKIILFDLMGEYTGLLIDQLLTLKKASLICLGKRTLPEPIIKYLNESENRPSLQEAAKIFSRYVLLPKSLKAYQDKMERALAKLLNARKVWLYLPEENMSIYDLFYGNHDRTPAKVKDRRVQKDNQRKALIREVLNKCGISGDYKNLTLNVELAQKIKEKLNESLKQPKYLEFSKDGDFSGVLEILEETIKRGDNALKCSVRLQTLLELLDKEEHPALVIINSHDPHLMRSFAYQLGEEAYERRRQSGRIFPLVSFIFDEADEFIRFERSGEPESYRLSREIAHTLARRGRKFGLGLGIATQRIRYLDTSIMAQPHTYLVSKLPRRSDREVVAEAFGIPEEMFRQTFVFTAGNWLLLSHDAAGLKAVPIPIKTEDANERIRRFLEQLD